MSWQQVNFEWGNS